MPLESSSINRSFNRELTGLTNKLVKITMPSGKWYRGILVGADLATLTICVDKVTSDSNDHMNKLLIRGGSWDTISLEDKPFPLETLNDRIAATFPPGQVKLIGDAISILNGKIKVTAAGVEGKGPTATHVQKIYDSFMEDLSKPPKE